MNASNNPLPREIDNATKKIIEEGFPAYLDAARCVHYFQTAVSEVLKSTLHSQQDRIVKSFKLPERVGEIGLRVDPDFPFNRYDNRECSISAYAKLELPFPCSIWLFVSFVETGDPSPVQMLYCALEVRTKRDLDRVQGFFRGREDRIEDEIWDGYPAGLKRKLRSPDTLRAELETLVDEFLTCCEGYCVQN